MATSYSAIKYFIGAYLHQDNELGIKDVIKEYLEEPGKDYLNLIEEINTLEQSPVSIEMKEQISAEIMRGVKPYHYPLSDNTISAYQWLLALKVEVSKIAASINDKHVR